MVHLSGGAVSGIVFGSLLFVLVSASLLLWWRRVHRDHFSKDPNAWGGSWGVKAMEEAQARMDAQREEERIADMRRLRAADDQRSMELRTMNSHEARDRGRDGVSGSAPAVHGVPVEVVRTTA